MTETAVSSRYTATRHVRTIDFIDRWKGSPEDAPVHVVSRVLINDEPATIGIRKGSMSVSVASHAEGEMGATVVTLDVARADVTLMDHDRPYDSDANTYRLGALECLAPYGRNWEVLDDDWVRVHFYVAQARFIMAE